jgi:hypothetical protein
MPGLFRENNSLVRPYPKGTIGFAAEIAKRNLSSFFMLPAMKLHSFFLLQAVTASGYFRKLTARLLRVNFR